jgi:hypothetical protein
LERSGAISGYRAHLDADALGLTFEALVFARVRRTPESTPAGIGSNSQRMAFTFRDP